MSKRGRGAGGIATAAGPAPTLLIDNSGTLLSPNSAWWSYTDNEPYNTAQQVTVTAGAKILIASFQLWAADPPPNGTTIAIYEDDGGQPGTLLARSAGVPLPTPENVAVCDFAFTNPPALPATIWVSIEWDNTDDPTGRVGQLAAGSVSFWDRTPPDPWGERTDKKPFWLQLWGSNP